MMDWFGCYSGGWKNEIQPEAFSHPAKFARGLIRRIYAHALEQGYLREGQTVLDPFGGVGLGAADALANGLHFVGVELEQNFVDMGGGCDCTGISKQDWVACFGRWKRFAHKDGRHWCPRCLAEAGVVLEDWEPALPGMEAPTTSYKRSSGKIPHTEPHRYTGNLDLFARHARDGATAVLVQGDSRNLVEVLEGARAEGIIASPPYVTTSLNQVGDPRVRANRMRAKGIAEDVITHTLNCAMKQEYGTDPAQLGNMPTGEPPQAVIGSPPYATKTVHGNHNLKLECFKEPKRVGKTSHAIGPRAMDDYGRTDGQLAAMREGDVDAVIASPPFASTLGKGGETKGFHSYDKDEAYNRCKRDYIIPDSDGQLAALPEGEPPKVDGLVSSPPYAGIRQDGGGEYAKAGIGGIRPYTDEPIDYWHTQRDQSNLGNMTEGEPPAGIVSSPPWETSLDRGTVPKEARVKQARDMGLSADKVSPIDMENIGFRTQLDYGSADGQLGQEVGATFWSAAKTILLQCHQILAPGGVAIFVTKRFVRDKQIVEFSQQWADLCQSCGFELVEWIKAWLVEERGTQYDLMGEARIKRVRHLSFFRRLHTQKFPHLAIEWEDVLIFRKGESC